MIGGWKMGSYADYMQGRVGSRTDKGTLITQGIVDAIAGDEAYAELLVQNNAAQIKAALGDAIVAALEEIGLVGESAAKKLCPVDTGRLRNSITHAINSAGRWVIIGTNVEYAEYVHEPVRLPNGKTRPGQPFLRDAAQSNYERFKSIVKKHLQNGH